MSTRFKVRDRKPLSQGSGRSLVWALLPSVVLVMATAFLAVQVLGIDPGGGAPSLAERLDVGRLAREANEHLFVLSFVVLLMMAGVLAALHLGLQPLRKISERAASIGPATISQRLPLNAAPREIAPLVVAFNAALDRLEAGWRAQQEFSANAAHELRTPLATLRAQVESLLEPEDRKDAIEEFDRLSRLIAQLLTLAEADSGEETPRGPFDLVAVAHTVTSEMAGSILASGRDVAFESAHDKWNCHGAPSLVEVALRNLLENATRHTPAGSEILVSIELGGQLVVSDNGPGVPPGFQDRLFRRFSKADTRGFGAGLGLSIVDRIMALHGGEVRLAPSPVGARFVLDFSWRGDAGLTNAHRSRTSRLWPRSMSPSAALTVDYRVEHA
ncbi:sensor histidine kinase [Caulobacter sp.]|uniref:sensor histidine kinase n=1 Tax=Caulobacter sp. TaxID=78 RepID=UPI003BB183CB